MNTKTLEDLETIDASYLGKLIGRSTKSIMVDVSQRPETLPPRLVIPGSRKVLWRVVDVREWMQALADMEKERREAARAASGDPFFVHTFHLGVDRRGAAATKRMKK